MKSYIRYIFCYLAGPVALVTFTLTGLAWLTQSLRFLDLIVNRGLSTGTFLYLSSLMLPSLLMVMMPVAVFCGIAYAYNRLVMDSEMVVLSSAGLSPLSLAKPALVMACLIAGLCYMISLYLLPASYREFKDLQTFIRDNYMSVLLQEGVFNTPLKGLMVYVEQRDGDGLLKGILVHDSRLTREPVTMMAEEGRLIRSDNGPRILLVHGNRQEVDAKTGNLSLLYFDQYELDLSLYTGPVKDRVHEPEERFLSELFNPQDKDLKPNMRDRLYAEGHQRLTWPLYNVVMACIAVATLLSGEFNRRGQWKRLLVATTFATVMIGVGLSMTSIVAQYPIMAPLMYVAIFAVIGLAWHSLSSTRYRKVCRKKRQCPFKRALADSDKTPSAQQA